MSVTGAEDGLEHGESIDLNKISELKSLDENVSELDYSCDDPKAVALMVDYIYTDTYTPEVSRKACDAETAYDESFNGESSKAEPSMTSGHDTFFFDTAPPPPPSVVEDDPWNSFVPRPKKSVKSKKKVSSNFWGINEPETDLPPPAPAPPQPSLTEHRQAPPSPQLPIPYGPSNLAMHAKLYAMGTKYGIPSLKSTALSKFIVETEDTWNSQDFAEAIGIGFGSTIDSDRGLCDAIVAAILRHSAALTEQAEIEVAIQEVEGLAYELFRLQSARAGKRSGK